MLSCFSSGAQLSHDAVPFEQKRKLEGRSAPFNKKEMLQFAIVITRAN